MDKLFPRIPKFCGPSVFLRCLYTLAFAGLISLSAFHTRTIAEGTPELIMYKLPDSLTRIDHSFTEQLLENYKKRQLAEQLVEFARQLEGRPYQWGGSSLKGFDCSGFVGYVYRHFGHALNRSSRDQSTEGKAVKLEEVGKGDLLFFTGSDADSRSVGHVGIVVSREEAEIQFVHASPNGGVKVSELEGYYATRFLAARRITELQ